MKKLIFASALVVGSLTAVNAQDKIAQATSQEQEAETVDQAITELQDIQDFKEIKASELPQPVLESVGKDFEGATVSKAYKNEKGEYKLVLATEKMGEKTVYANAKGEWLKKQ
ncbi:hypothetical protein MG296_05715 [Flavobacteriaceae bacterium TK19130]|nr:hypothetical protein [Thermobacterium salinum]